MSYDRISLGIYGTLLQDKRFHSIMSIALVGIMGSLVASPALPAIATAFSLSDSQTGLVMTAFTFPVILCVPIAGALVDTVGRRPVVLGALLLFGTAGAVAPLAPSFSVLLGLRVIQGIGFAGTTPIAIALIGDIYSGKKGASAQGLFISATGVVTILLPLVAGYLAQMSWSLAFMLYAIAFGVAGIVFLTLPETAVERGNQTLRREVSEYWMQIRSTLDDLTTLLVIGGGFVHFFNRFTILTFGPLIAVREFSLDVFAAGLLISVSGVARLLVSPFNSVVIARTSRKEGIVLATFLSAIGTAAIPLVPSVSLLVGSVAIYSIGDALLSPVLNDSVANLATDRTRGGLASGLSMFRNVGKTTAPVVLGVILAVSSFTAAFAASAIIVAVYGLVTHRYIRPIDTSG